MRIEVTGRHLELTAPIEQYVREKCDRLPKFYNGVLQVSVVLEHVEHNEFEASVMVDVVKHGNFVGASRGQQLYSCVDEAVEKVVRQLTDYKEKLRQAKH